MAYRGPTIRHWMTSALALTEAHTSADHAEATIRLSVPHGGRPAPEVAALVQAALAIQIQDLHPLVVEVRIPEVAAHAT